MKKYAGCLLFIVIMFTAAFPAAFFLSTGRLVFEFEQARLESTKLFIRTGVEQPLCVDRHRGLANLACSQRGVDSAGFDSLGAAMDIERGVVVVIFWPEIAGYCIAGNCGFMGDDTGFYADDTTTGSLGD